MAPDSKKDKEKIEGITKSDLLFQEETVEALHDMAKNVVKLQQDLSGIMTPTLRKSLRAMSRALPALEQIAQTAVSIRDVNEYMANSLKVFTSSQASMYNKRIAGITSKMMNVNDHMDKIATELAFMFALLSDVSNVMILPEPVDIRPILRSGSKSAQTKIRALEKALATLYDELNEKEEENKELRTRIKELLEKTKKIQVV